MGATHHSITLRVHGCHVPHCCIVADRPRSFPQCSNAVRGTDADAWHRCRWRPPVTSIWRRPILKPQGGQHEKAEMHGPGDRRSGRRNLEFSGGIFRAKNNTAAGTASGDIAVSGNGELQVYECDLTNGITMSNGTMLSAEGGNVLTDDVYGSIILQGGVADVRIKGWKQTLALRGVISGSGGLDLASTFANMYLRAINIYGDNTFTGLVAVGSWSPVATG